MSRYIEVNGIVLDLKKVKDMSISGSYVKVRQKHMVMLTKTITIPCKDPQKAYDGIMEEIKMYKKSV